MRRKKALPLVVVHCAMFGRVERQVKSYKVGPPVPFTNYPIGLIVTFTEPRAKTDGAYTIVPGNTRYVTVEDRGRVLYDSRTQIPCDMEAWRRTWEQFNGTTRSETSEGST